MLTLVFGKRSFGQGYGIMQKCDALEALNACRKRQIMASCVCEEFAYYQVKTDGGPLSIHYIHK